MAMARRVGDLGEDDFQRWCTLNRLEWTKSARDRMGWDHLVEFEAAEASVGLDSQNELKKALVQLKSSDRNERSVMAKLSALKLLVDAEMPSFVVSIHYAGGTAAQQAWVLHIGEQEIEAILRKVRERESKGRPDLHTFKLRLSLRNAAPLRPDGSDLAQRLLNCIGTSMSDYVAGKAAFRRTCGYDEMPFHGEARLAKGIGPTQIADWEIGRLPHLPLAEAKVQKVRFGIALDKETQHIGPSLAMTQVTPLWKGTVTVTSKAYETSEMFVDVYCSNPMIGRKTWRMRLANRFLDIYLPRSDKWEFIFTIDEKQAYELAELVQALKFGSLIAEKGSQLRIRVGIGEGLDIKDVPVHNPAFAHFKHLCGFAGRLSSALHRSPLNQHMQATVKEVDEALWANEKAYSLLSCPGFGMTFSLEEATIEASERVKSAVMLMPLCMDFKDVVYHAIVRIEAASVSCNEGTLQFTGGWPHVVDEGVMLKREAKDLGRRLIERARSLRAKENSDNRMVIGFQDVVVGLNDEEEVAVGAISW